MNGNDKDLGTDELISIEVDQGVVKLKSTLLLMTVYMTGQVPITLTAPVMQHHMTGSIQICLQLLIDQSDYCQPVRNTVSPVT